MHIVEGLLVAQDIIDQVITIIRKSKDGDEAKWGLTHILSASLYEHPTFQGLARIDPAKARAQMEALVARVKGAESSYAGLSHKYDEGGFSEVQAQNILDMRLQRLTGMQREELFQELLSLLRQISSLRDILGNESSLMRVIKAELAEIRERYGDQRRTEIIGEASEFTSEDLIAEEDMVVTLSHAGYVKRSPLTEYRAQKRGGKGKTGVTMKEDDFVKDVFVASTHAFLMPITTRGKLYWLKVHEIPQASRTARGKAIVNLVQLTADDKLAAVLTTREFTENQYVFFVTRKGVVKRTDLTAFSNIRAAGIIALGIEDGDALVSVKITDGTKDVLLSTAQGMSIRFPESEVRSMGRQAYGVKGITLEDGDEVVGADIVEKDTAILTVTQNGYGKRTSEGEYRVQGRGGKGIIDIKTTERNGRVVGIAQVRDTDEVMLVTNRGMLIRMKVKEISVIGRNTQGVRLISVGDGEEKVVGISRLPESTEGEGEGEVSVPLGHPLSTAESEAGSEPPESEEGGEG
jgi:DNA gyrase subunit A